MKAQLSRAGPNEKPDLLLHCAMAAQQWVCGLSSSGSASVLHTGTGLVWIIDNIMRSKTIINHNQNVGKHFMFNQTKEYRTELLETRTTKCETHNLSNSFLTSSRGQSRQPPQKTTHDILRSFDNSPVEEKMKICCRCCTFSDVVKWEVEK